MTSHLPVPTIAHEESSLPNQPFFSWVKGHTTLFISQIVAILGFVSVPASTIYYVRKGGEPEWELLKPERITVLVDYAHITFIVVAILALIRVLHDNERGSYRVGLVYKQVFEPNLPEGSELSEEHKQSLRKSKIRLRRFKTWFLWFWLAMFLLYVSFAFQHTYTLATVSFKSAYIEVSSNGLWPYRYVHQPASLDWHKTVFLMERPLHGLELAKSLGFSFLVFVLNNFSILFVFCCYTVLYLPLDDRVSKKKRLRFYLISAGVLGLLTFLFPLLLIIGKPTLDAAARNSYVAVFDALSGTVNAIIFALLIARLDSKLIGLRSWLICILYSYAAVQPLFVVFGQETEVFKQIMTIVLIFVFVSKVYFFLIIMYALQTGRMLNYLFCYPILDRKVDNALKSAREKGLLWTPRDVTAFAKVLGVLALAYFFGSLINYAGVLGGLSRFSQFLPHGVLALMGPILHPSNVVIDFGQLGFILIASIVVWAIRKRSRQEAKDVADISADIFPKAELAEDKKPVVEKSDKIAKEGSATKASTETERPNRASDQLKRFKTYFLWFWIVTFPLYCVLLWKHWNQASAPGQEPHGFWDMVMVLGNPFLTFALGTLNLLFVFRCFVVMQSPMYDDPSETRDPLRTKEKSLFDRYEARQKLLLNYSAFIVALLISAFVLLLVPVGGSGFSASELKDYATVFDGVTGTLSAVALSLLIARLDSKFIDLSPLLVYLLFTYAAVQPLLVVFEQAGEVFRTIETAVLTFAFLLKICLFLTTLHVLRNGNMLIYLVCFPELHKRVDSIFENQFEIRVFRERAGSFSFSIWKKNHLVYVPGTSFKSRGHCDQRIKKLSRLMKSDNSYRFSNAAGTHWIRIVDPKQGEKLMCESIALRSLEDAEDLKHESKEKIPFCKYDRA